MPRPSRTGADRRRLPPADLERTQVSAEEPCSLKGWISAMYVALVISGARVRPQFYASQTPESYSMKTTKL